MGHDYDAIKPTPNFEPASPPPPKSDTASQRNRSGSLSGRDVTSREKNIEIQEAVNKQLEALKIDINSLTPEELQLKETHLQKCIQKGGAIGTHELTIMKSLADFKSSEDYLHLRPEEKLILIKSKIESMSGLKIGSGRAPTKSPSPPSRSPGPSSAATRERLFPNPPPLSSLAQKPPTPPPKSTADKPPTPPPVSKTVEEKPPTPPPRWYQPAKGQSTSPTTSLAFEPFPNPPSNTSLTQLSKTSPPRAQPPLAKPLSLTQPPISPSSSPPKPSILEPSSSPPKTQSIPPRPPRPPRTKPIPEPPSHRAPLTPPQRSEIVYKANSPKVTQEELERCHQDLEALKNLDQLDESTLVLTTAARFRADKKPFDLSALPEGERAKYESTLALLNDLHVSDSKMQARAKKIGHFVHNQLLSINVKDFTVKGVRQPGNSITNTIQKLNQLRTNIISEILTCNNKSEAVKKYRKYLNLAATLASQGDLNTAQFIQGALNDSSVYKLFFPKGGSEEDSELFDHLSTKEKKIYNALNTLFKSQNNFAEVRKATNLLNTTLPLYLAGKDITGGDETANLAIRYNLRARLFSDAVPIASKSGSEITAKEEARYFGTSQTKFNDQKSQIERNDYLRDKWYR